MDEAQEDGLQYRRFWLNRCRGEVGQIISFFDDPVFRKKRIWFFNSDEIIPS
jgi:hypothetical protein